MAGRQAAGERPGRARYAADNGRTGRWCQPRSSVYSLEKYDSRSISLPSSNCSRCREFDKHGMADRKFKPACFRSQVSPIEGRQEPLRPASQNDEMFVEIKYSESQVNAAMAEELLKKPRGGRNRGGTNLQQAPASLNEDASVTAFSSDRTFSRWCPKRFRSHCLPRPCKSPAWD